MPEMKLPIFDTRCTDEQQMKKVREEFFELYDEHAMPLQKIDRILEEAFDTIQAIVGYIRIMGTQEEIEYASRKHVEKLIGRGWKIDGYINMVVDMHRTNKT